MFAVLYNLVPQTLTQEIYRTTPKETLELPASEWQSLDLGPESGLTP